VQSADAAERRATRSDQIGGERRWGGHWREGSWSGLGLDGEGS
jgi:hypothetical protein